jgi:ribonuclease T2
MRPKRLIIAFVLAMALGPAVAAAGPACRPPTDLAPAPALARPPGEIQKGVVIVSQLLAINWTPEWCRTNGQGITAQRMDCDRPAGFTLHGLWPNGVGKPYPRYCEPVGGLRPATVRRMYCRTPSAELLQHEWAAHGACGWTDADAYFAQAARLFDRVALPRIETIAPGDLTAGAVRRAFMARNRWLKADMIFVQTDRSDRLTEVRLCYDARFRPAACIGGTGTPDAAHLQLTPSATGAF